MGMAGMKTQQQGMGVMMNNNMTSGHMGGSMGDMPNGPMGGMSRPTMVPTMRGQPPQPMGQRHAMVSGNLVRMQVCIPYSFVVLLRLMGPTRPPARRVTWGRKGQLTGR